MNLTYADIQRVAVALDEMATVLHNDATRHDEHAKDFENCAGTPLPGVLRMRAANYKRISELFAGAAAVELTRGDDRVVTP